MKFNYSRLLGRIREKGFTHADVAKHIGIVPSTFSLKLKCETVFNAYEIMAICKLLDIPAEEIGIYFFAI